MARDIRHSTNYPGVYWVGGKSVTGKSIKVFWVRYRRDGKLFEERVGTSQTKGMNALVASSIREKKIIGNAPTNAEERESRQVQKEAEDNRWTISKLWTDYKEHRPDLKGLTTDENRFQNYIEKPLGNKEPAEIVPLDTQRLVHVALKKRSPATARNVLELLRRIINYGARNNYCSPLAFKVDMPKVNNLKTEDLTPAQVKTLLEVIEADTHGQAGPMMELALFTGMRRGELFRLQWEDVDFHRGFIHIRNPKGNVDQKIPLNDGARNVLENVLDTDSPYVFPGRKGNRRADIKKAVNAIKEKAGLPADFRALHGLRHVYASMLASSGKVDMYTLQKLLTHKSSAMTQRYAHLRDETLRNASDVAHDIIMEALDVKKSDEEQKKVVTIRR